jgi:uncharacterized alkaline shock family protein YloU
VTETTQQGTTSTSRTRPSGPSGAELVSEQGRTTIADTVVGKIVGIAARDVSGVHEVGAGATRMAGAIRERIPGSSTNYAQGVSVEVGERQAAADIDIIADYGVSLADLAAAIRRNVIASVERMTGLQVVEVNITVHDLYVETGTDEDRQQQSRVD